MSFKDRFAQYVNPIKNKAEKVETVAKAHDKGMDDASATNSFAKESKNQTSMDKLLLED